MTSKLAAASEELSDSTRARDALQRQVKRVTDELAAAVKHADKVSRHWEAMVVARGLLTIMTPLQLERDARCEMDALQAQMSLADQDRVSNEKRLPALWLL